MRCCSCRLHAGAGAAGRAAAGFALSAPALPLRSLPEQIAIGRAGEAATGGAQLGGRGPQRWIDHGSCRQRHRAPCPLPPTACSVFNGVGGAGVKYVTSTQNDDHCLPGA